MFRSLNVKLVLIFIIFIISTMSVVGVFLLDRVSSFYADDFIGQMDSAFSEHFVDQLEECLSDSNFARAQKEILVAYSGNFSFDTYRNFYILDMDGNVLESSDGKIPSKTKNLLSAMNRKGEKNTVSGSGYFDYAVHLSGGKNECIIYIHDDLTRMKSLIWVLFSIIMQALFIGLAIALFLCFFLTKAITSPIQKLTAGAKTIASGHYNYRIESQSKDEIGELTDNFNQMAQTIENSMKQVSDEREKLRTIFEHLKDGVAAFDENGKQLHINQAAYDMLGISERPPMGFNEFTKALGMQEVTTRIMKKTTTIKIPEFNLSVSGKKDIIADLSLTVFSYDVGRIGYLIVIQDITDRALLEKSRREFIANVSHELRTPLTSIKGATEIIIDDAEMPEEMRKRFLSIVMNESDRMTRIVKDLLVLSRLENRRMSWKKSRFKIHDALVQVCDALRTSADEKGHEFRVISDPEKTEYISADKERIEQVLTNIVGNAIKYTPDHGKITVTLEPSSEEGFSYEIKVSDNGVGIAEKDIPRLFERFYRVDKARNSDVGGTGLGLSIAKEIVDAHHGKIYVESEQGVGTTVTMLFPADTAVCEED